MQKLWDTLDKIYDFITNIPQFVIDTIKKLITSFFTMFKDLFIWIFKQMLDLVITILNGFDLSAINASLGSYSLPPEIVNMLGLIGVGEALGIIVAALTIRFLLQLIPFVRLGS